ncbi:nucleoside kinase [Mobilitalea sibirica]|uniref:Nucleoside kinase n=1 Tax=Mobilitalea sibirica TaxID=1462919 RepID=A0A8J7L2D3_9FIRM|nr:nucleoside kinase [Mobilitalea sibirica]MBH1940343.1 nucleoside kinase [Mobilitalea sibirica]
MKTNVIVQINGIEKEYPINTSLLEIAKEYKKDYKDDIILAYVNNKLRELFKTVTKDCEIRFVTTRDDAGHKTYMRGLILVMLKAFYSEIGSDNVDKVEVEYSIGNGLYCHYTGKLPLTKERIQAVKKRMEEIISKDIPFIKRSIGTDDAMELFRLYRMHDKEKLFRYRRVSKANIYNLDGFEDYYYGYMPPSSGMLKYFDLTQYDEGFLLLMPNEKDPTVVKPFVPQVKLFHTMKESNQWAKMMDIENVGALNDIISQGRFGDLILVQEALQEKKISEIAEAIKKAGGKKFIMIAGPSSSGKTTFSHRLSIQLKAHGMKPHPIAVDNYFVDREKTPRDEKGNYNFESLYAIDLEQFNQDMTNLLNGETVDIPVFNFITGQREYKGNYTTLGDEDILVIEGIHGLNDALSYSLPRESKYKIYISALTQLNIDEHNRIPTTDGRLIRRMVRDARTRGASAKTTIAMWPSVRRGEEENIFPFQEDADVMFNSALIYELAILKQYAEPILFGIDRNCEEYVEAKRLLKFLDYFIGTPAEAVPKNSILKEFIGGSCFKV